MASAFLCASLGISPTVRHADYIGNWLQLTTSQFGGMSQAAQRDGTGIML